MKKKLSNNNLMGKNKKKKSKNNKFIEKKIKKGIKEKVSEKEEKVEKIQNNEEEKMKSNKVVSKHTYKHSSTCKIGKKIKNLTSLSILLFGFVVGSLFVDVAQLYNKEGFSSLALKSANIINYNGNTWVRYNDPKVIVDVVVSDECKDECEIIDDLLSNLRSEIPTLEAHKINISKSEYETYAKNNNITNLPAFVFDNSLENINFYKEGELIFDKKENGKIHIKMNELGIQTIELATKIEEDVTKDNSSIDGYDNKKENEGKNNSSSAVSI